MVSSRKTRNESNSGDDFEISFDPEIKKEFDQLDKISFPAMDFDPPPEKSLKERILEQHRERAEAIKAHEKRFYGEPTVSDDLLLLRNDREFESFEASSITKTTIFREDLESFDKISEPEMYLSPHCQDASNFEDLHEPRRRVLWNKSTQEDFHKNSKILDKSLKLRGIPRVPNVSKRFENLAKVNLRIDRWDREEAVARSIDPEIDEANLFGHLELLPNTLTKSEKPSMERKRDVFNRYVDLLHDSDYSNRAGNKEKEEYAELLKRKEELESFLENPKLEAIPYPLSSISTEKQESAYEAQRAFDFSDSGVVFDNSSINSSSSSSSNSKHKEPVFEKRLSTEAHSTVESPVVLKSLVSPSPQKSVEKESQMRKTDEAFSSFDLSDQVSQSSVPIVKQKENESLKRKISDIPDAEPPKKVEKGHGLSSEFVKEQIGDSEKIKKIDKYAEDMKRERERRKEAMQKREQEAIEKQKKKAEELKRMQEKEEKEESAQRKERMRLQRLVEEENYRATEEHKKAVQAEDEKRRLKEKEEKDRKYEEEEKLELEKLKKMMEQRQKAEASKTPIVPAVPATMPVRRPPVPLSNRYVVMKCKVPAHISERKEKFFNEFKWPSNETHRHLERTEEVAKLLKKTENGAKIIIPQENNATTIVHPLIRPVKRRPSQGLPAVAAAPIIVAPVPIRPEDIPANNGDVEKVIAQASVLMEPTRKRLAIFYDLCAGEINYMSCGLDRLKMNILYPFRQSDGMYWPVFHALKDTRAETHVAALTKNHSCSGKYSSFHLLTSSKEDDARRSSRFDTSYADSGGDWADYSQKPGRFSRRIGFQAHRNQCKESFDIQRQRARETMKSQFDREREDYNDFERSRNEYNQRKDRNKYKQKLTIHLRELVADARLDLYSLRETFQDIEGGVMDHPGTRESPLELWWYAHGYRLFVETRDREFGIFMHSICRPYEDLLPSPSRYSLDKFTEWCCAPMLASLWHQLKYKPFDSFPKEDMVRLINRRKKYDALLKDTKFDLKEALEVCRLTETDKKQWTILNDQLAAQFKDFPAIFQIMFDPQCNAVSNVDKIIHELMRTAFKERSNTYDYIKTQFKFFRNFR